MQDVSKAKFPAKCIWDHDLAREHYDRGLSFEAIAELVNASVRLIKSYAQHHWPLRSPAPAKPKPQRRGRRPGEATLPPLQSLG